MPQCGGRYRTIGKFASGTAGGTVWQTQDTPGATVIRVKSGIVDVYDRVKRRHVIVRRGQRPSPDASRPSVA